MFLDFFNSSARMLRSSSTNPRPEDPNKQIAMRKHLTVNYFLGMGTHLRGRVGLPTDWQ